MQQERNKNDPETVGVGIGCILGPSVGLGVQAEEDGTEEPVCSGSALS